MSRSERIRTSRSRSKRRGRPSDVSAEEDEGSGRPAEDISDGTATPSETDALLDEIDRVLESNAEDFVRGYLQKGGE